MRKDRQQRNQTTMAPAHDPHPPRIDLVVRLQHELSRRMNVLHFQSAVVDTMPIIAPVTAAAAIVRCDDRIALLDQLADHHSLFITRHVPMNLAMSEHNQWKLAQPDPLPRKKGHRRNQHFIAAWRGSWITSPARRRTSKMDLIDDRH